jgi:glucose-1-phosphate thymidylyltransferase
LHDASAFVRTIEKRQGMKVMCLEEIALELGYLNPADLRLQADKLGSTEYADYLRRRADEHGRA